MPEPMRLEVLECGPDLPGATAVVTGRFARSPRPKAVFALFIEATLAVLREVNRLNLQVPADLSLAGFDDSEWLQVVHPPVAAVIQPMQALAEAAWSRLMELIELGKGEHRLTCVACTLDIRASIAAPTDNGPPVRTVSTRRNLQGSRSVANSV
jgi:LacI family transcriptional regulator